MSKEFSNTALGRFRLVGIAEGFSYLLLLFIGMPAKYLLHTPSIIKVMGWMHGVLFILYVIALINVAIANKWSILKTLLAFVVSLIPFATFVFDKTLREEEKKMLELNLNID